MTDRKLAGRRRPQRRGDFFVAPIIGACFISGSAVWGADPGAVEAKKAMVAAAEPLAVDAGLEVLKHGGNAVDAAVAVGFALAVTYPIAGNLGGGGFLVASLETEKGRQAVALDFREAAPSQAHPNLYGDARADGHERPSTLGHLAAGVPGSVAGLLEALERWGTLGRNTVLAPAIRLATEGFPISRRTHRSLANESIAAGMKQFAGTRRLYYPGGEPLREGALWRQPELANTLRRIAEQGRKGFYEGPVADAIVNEMKRGGGIITHDDLRGYRVIDRDVVSFPYKGLTVLSMPPPSSGGVCLRQMLGILERYPLARHRAGSSATFHLLAEAMRRSFRDRNEFLGDPDHQAIPLEKLLEPAHLEELASTIDFARATPSRRLLGGSKPSGEQTTHYSVVDKSFNAVAVTTTLNGAFGAKVVVEGAGFLLNNEMDDFTTEPGKPNLYGLVQGNANAVGPGRRPLSSMTPTVVLDSAQRPIYVLGTPGGPTIITNVLQVFLNLVEFGLEPQAAVNAPKIHHQCLPDQIFHEREIAADVLEALRKRGHTLKERSWIGDVQLIAIDHERGVLLGASDPRGEGKAAGY